MKRPSFQFYPGDWLRDMSLRGCSIEARGLWIDLLCLMHDGSPYGHLATSGGPWSDDQGARATGLLPKVYKHLLGELESAQVFSRDPRGAIYNRRMVKDELIRVKRAEAGRSGGLVAQAKYRAPPEANTQANHQANSQAEAEHLVASADAEAEGSSEKGFGEKPPGPVFGKLLRRLSGHPHRFAILDLLTEQLPDGRDPDAWAGTMIGCLDGLLLAGGKKATTDELAAACLEYPGIDNCGWAPTHFIAAVERTVARMRRPERPDTRPTVSNIRRAVDEFVQGGK